MSAKNKTEELKGKAKQRIGKATGNTRWQAEGKTDQAKANLKAAGKKVKDALTNDRDGENGNRR